MAKASLDDLLNQRVQRLVVVQELQSLPVRRKDRIPVLTTDEGGEDRRQIPAGRPALLAGVRGQARLVGQA